MGPARRVAHIEAAALLLCAACGGRPHWSGGDPELFGVVLAVDPAAADFTHAAGFRPDVRRVLDATSRYFAHDPAELDGLRIIMLAELDSGERIGSYRPEENTITVATIGFPCLEATALTHELLHFWIGDPNHTDPRWLTLGALAQSLSCAP